MRTALAVPSLAMPRADSEPDCSRLAGGWRAVGGAAEGSSSPSTADRASSEGEGWLPPDRRYCTTACRLSAPCRAAPGASRGVGSGMEASSGGPSIASTGVAAAVNLQDLSEPQILTDPVGENHVPPTRVQPERIFGRHARAIRIYAPRVVDGDVLTRRVSANQLVDSEHIAGPEHP